MVIHRQQKGYSLVELLLILGIMGIFLTISIPALSQSMRRYSARAGAHEFVSHLRLARHLAIARHQPVDMAVGAEDYSLPNWSDGDIGTAGLREFSLPRACTIVSGTGTITFRTDGTISTGATTVRLEIALDGQITARYDIAISTAGQITTTYTQVTS
ncbi:MAG: GspH/FimT family pseudopilin [Acidobacteria bacterium]|nr:GspH/FimT family pseudopilin [Acidobacteriota bacterium]